MARFFKTRYLWIDSLSTVQDSVEDWNKKAVLMSEVYHNAIWNIAATGASDSNMGLFFDRNPQSLQPCPGLASIQREGPREVRLRDGFRMLEKSNRHGPLVKRAWDVQEGLLARRVLHFGRDQLLWECQEKSACEVFPKKIPLVP